MHRATDFVLPAHNYRLLTCPLQPRPHPGQSRQSPHPLPPLLRPPPGRAGKEGRTPRCGRRGSTRTRCRGTCRCRRAAACRSCAAPWRSWHRPDGAEEGKNEIDWTRRRSRNWWSCLGFSHCIKVSTLVLASGCLFNLYSSRKSWRTTPTMALMING